MVESISDVRKKETVVFGQEMVVLYAESPCYLQVTDVGKQLRVGMEVEILAGRGTENQTCPGNRGFRPLLFAGGSSGGHSFYCS